MINNAALSNFWQSFSVPNSSSLVIPSVLFCIIMMMVVPLPPFLLDLFFTFNITLSLVIAMICINALKPLDFSSFPTVLLFATLLRLALNVASTRVILVEGHNGTDSAGTVIQAFGDFIIGGNYFVGIIVFSILMIINFIVITKGAGRVSEVTARFTLDAMPGKQMAIDADLNAGIITKENAKQRREEVAAESEFYGSMDGASKFVKGDVIAGFIILIINIVGGLVIGTTTHGMTFDDAAHTYVLLTIGDGLVAQIPSLLLSTATAIIITRVSSSTSMHSQLKLQMGDPQPLAVTAGILTILGFIPGMPHFVFLFLAAIVGCIAFYSARSGNYLPSDTSAQGEGGDVEEDEDPKTKELSWDDVPRLDVIGLEVGYALIPLIDQSQGGDLMQRIKGVRKKVSHDLGFLVPTVRLRDNLEFSPNQYRININGVSRGQSELIPGKELAINPGVTHGELSGIDTQDPAFGMPAVWIDPSEREYAHTLGYTVVDPSTALATHLNKIILENAKEVFGYDEAQQLLDQLAEVAPKLVETLVPNKLSLGAFTTVLQNLLAEEVPIRDMRTIVETLLETAEQTQNPDLLTAAVRPTIGRMIVQSLVDVEESLKIITLSTEMEQLLHDVLTRSQEQGLAIEPNLAEQLLSNLKTSSEDIVNQGIQPILVVSPGIRPWIAKMVRHRIHGITIIGYNEIPDEKEVHVIHTVEYKSDQ